MKWMYYPLLASDERACQQIAQNFQCVDTGLVRKLQAWFSLGIGEMLAIALEDVDFQTLADFSHATYRTGKQWYEAAATDTIPTNDRPIDGLISFLSNFLVLLSKPIDVVLFAMGASSYTFCSGRSEPLRFGSGDAFCCW